MIYTIKKGCGDMLKYINIQEQVDDNKITQDLYNEILSNLDYATFNVCGYNEFLVFNSNCQNDIENRFKIDLSNADDISVYINCYDGGEFYQLYDRQIGIDECIDILLDNIEQYESLLMQSKNMSEIISILIKQQIPNVISLDITRLQKEMSRLRKDVNRDCSNIEWK